VETLLLGLAVVALAVAAFVLFVRVGMLMGSGLDRIVQGRVAADSAQGTEDVADE
jgi:hypothetical protein